MGKWLWDYGEYNRGQDHIFGLYLHGLYVHGEIGDIGGGGNLDMW